MDQKIAKIRARAELILDIARGMAEKADKAAGTWTISNRMEEIRLNFNGYEEPGYDSPDHGLVATGDWNGVSTYNSLSNELHRVSSLPERVRALFEKLGIPCEWCDEWTECAECVALVRTRADSYCWKPSFVSTDDGYVCHTCTLKDPDRYLEDLEGNPNNAITLEIDPEDHGYKCIKDDCETGWHPGQNDDPKKIAQELRAKGVDRFLFKIDSAGQFDTRWSVYVHESECELLKGSCYDEPEEVSYNV